MDEERFPIGSTPELLAIASWPLVREFLFSSACSRWVLDDEFLLDTPAEERSDVVPVGVGRRSGDLTSIDAFLQLTPVLAHVRHLQLVERLDGLLAICEPATHSSITRRALRW